MKSAVSKVLVVVDMQNCFRAASSPALRRRVHNAIVHARQEGWLIVNLMYELESHDDTTLVPGLKSVLKANRAVDAWKDEDDGGRQVAARIRRRGIKPTDIYMTGVNATCCVAETAERLASIYPNATVHITGAVGDDDVNFPERPVLIGCNRLGARDASRYGELRNVRANSIFGRRAA